MQLLNNNIQSFLTLVRAGLWEKEARLLSFGTIDFTKIYTTAEEQSVVGLVTAGLEQVKDIKIPKELTLQFIGNTLQLENRNKTMNEFISNLIRKLRNVGVYALLVKGQGIAQCYERPLWRACGDIDLLLEGDDYIKASALLPTLASSIDENRPATKHFAMTIEQWEVELHGTLRSQLGKKIDDVIDEVQADSFRNGHVRAWRNGNIDVFLPAPDNDVIFVFSHILQHFFRGGIGLRQICDWCRLLWTYREKLNTTLLENRLRKMGLMSEWKAFASLAVGWLGMPLEAMPLYSSSRRWKCKAKKIMCFIFETGNFGRSRDYSFKRTWLYLCRRRRPYFIYYKAYYQSASYYWISSVRNHV